MPYLLNLAYLLLLLLASPWLLYRTVRHGKYRQGLAARLFGQVPSRSGEQPCLWLHAVSVGEVNLLQPLQLLTYGFKALALLTLLLVKRLKLCCQSFFILRTQ